MDGPESRTFNELDVQLWPRLSWSPSFAVTFSDLKVNAASLAIAPILRLQPYAFKPSPSLQRCSSSWKDTFLDWVLALAEGLRPQSSATCSLLSCLEGVRA